LKAVSDSSVLISLLRTELDEGESSALAQKRLRSSRSAKHRRTRSANLERKVYLGLQIQPPCAGFEPAFLFYASL
jgi:hypothetical protein